MKQLLLIIQTFLTLPLLLPAAAYAAESESVKSSSIVINEIQTGGAASAGQEFVELYNRSRQDAFDLTGWRLEYRSAAGVTWHTKAELEGEVHPGGYYLLASTDYLSDQATQSFNAGFAKTGGQLRLTRPVIGGGAEILDLVGWGTAQMFEGHGTALAPAEGASIERVVVSGFVQDTNDNSVDFVAQIQPTPSAVNEPAAYESLAEQQSEETAAPEEVAPQETEELPEQQPHPAFDREEPPVSPDQEPVVEDQQQDNLPVDPTPEQSSADDSPFPEETPEDPPANEDTLPFESQDDRVEQSPVKVHITELLPDPVSPATDAQDEFIELYNAGAAAVDLSGYQLQTGNSFNDTFDLDGKIEPGAYTAFYARDTKLTLTNSGSNVRLVDASGAEVAAAEPYGKAVPGQSWVPGSAKWQWTQTPTPGDLNILTTVQSSDSPIRKTSGTRQASEESDADNAALSGEVPPVSTDTDNPERAIDLEALQLSITELLPNPASPLTDSEDEFVELHNASNQAYSLEGFVLQSGTNYTYSYTIGDVSIPAYGYVVFFSSETSLTLSNSAGRVRLLAPDKRLVAESDTYGKAADGQAWAIVSGSWRWTGKPTPGSPNELVAPAAKSTSKAATAKKSSAKKTAATKSSAKKTAGTAATAKDYQDPEEAESKTSLHYGILAGVGAIAVLYAAYEYRTDMANRIYQFRRYLAYRRKTGKKIARRGSY